MGRHFNVYGQRQGKLDAQRRLLDRFQSASSGSRTALHLTVPQTFFYGRVAGSTLQRRRYCRRRLHVKADFLFRLIHGFNLKTTWRKGEILNKSKTKKNGGIYTVL